MLLVTLALVCSLFATSTVLASNVITPGVGQQGGDFTFSNDNWTPVKTINGGGYADEFWINGWFQKADNYNGLVKLTLKIKRVRDNQIIYSQVFYPGSDGVGHFNTGRIAVNPNEERIQIYMDSTTYNATPPGPYRSLFISYDFNLA